MQMQSSVILMEPLAELCWRDADDLREDARKVIRIVKTHGRGDSGDAFVGKAKRILRKLHAHLVDVDVDVDTSASLEDTAEIRVAAMTEFGKLRDGNAILIIDTNVLQSMRKNRVFAGIMIAADCIRMRLCTAQQMIDLTEIF